LPQWTWQLTAVGRKDMAGLWTPDNGQWPASYAAQIANSLPARDIGGGGS